MDGLDSAIPTISDRENGLATLISNTELAIKDAIRAHFTPLVKSAAFEWQRIPTGDDEGVSSLRNAGVNGKGKSRDGHGRSRRHKDVHLNPLRVCSYRCNIFHC